MKTLKVALLITTMAFTSASAFAQPTFTGGKYINQEVVKTISVAPTTTSDLAYQQALTELNSLKNMTPRELNKQLSLRTFDIVSNSTYLQDGSFVTVQERMNEEGKLEYLGTVNVKVNYAQRDSNR
ncbi:DUF3316 domain-containing protein [Vibrio rotiferianus]|jgi:hypothetical protein|uniref:DUF3316 domain-containing protein n=1 Tax=Vibrio rotiferianus TaxID=190895 RepID=UPI00406A5961